MLIVRKKIFFTIKDIKDPLALLFDYCHYKVLTSYGSSA